MKYVILGFLVSLFLVSSCFGFGEREYSSDDFISESTQEEEDPLLVSLCVVTDNFSQNEYERFKAGAGLAAKTFEPFGLDFYIAAHEDKGFPKQLNRALVPLWRVQVEARHNVECDIMVLVTKKDYTHGGRSFAGIALLPWNGILVDSFSSVDFPTLKRVTQHELGHIFGAEHVDTPGSVMRPQVGPNQDNWDDLNFDIIMENRYKFTPLEVSPRKFIKTSDLSHFIS